MAMSLWFGGPSDSHSSNGGDASKRDARGRYLIPGLWDMHTHPHHYSDLYYTLFLANGVTGIRNAGSPVPLDTLMTWRREILAGTRVGPPRQLLSGQSVYGPDSACHRDHNKGGTDTCVRDSADARHYVDSLKAAGADMIKPRAVTKALYFAIAREARRIGIPFGGHVKGLQNEDNVSASEASDSGARIVDHLNVRVNDSDGVYGLCWASTKGASLAKCQALSDKFRHNGTWLVPTLIIYYNFADFLENDKLNDVEHYIGPFADTLFTRLGTRTGEFWSGSLLHGNWLRDSGNSNSVTKVGISGSANSTTEAANASGKPGTGGKMGHMGLMVRAGLPVMAGTDVSDGGFSVALRSMPPGFSLLTELAMYQSEGLTPLEALQTATLNPAKMLHATDSMGTVAKGKLADLVLLDADPLTDITNVTTIRAVVANGRYFDRDALDQLLKWVQAQKKWN